MNTIAVTITADDIAHGTRGCCQDCAMARALNREHPLGAPWTVGTEQAMPEQPRGTGYGRYNLLPDAFAFRVALDRGDGVQPATVHLEAA